MAIFRIRKNDWTSLTGTLSVRLYPIGSATIANAGGDALALVTGSGGLWEAAVAEALSGLHMFVIYLDAFPIFEGTIDITDPDGPWNPDEAYPILSSDSGATSLLRSAGLSITVLPGFFLNQRRNIANSIDLYVGELGSYSVPILDANKEPLDLSGDAYELRFANAAGTLIDTIAANTDTPGTMTFIASVDLTETAISEGVFSLRKISNSMVAAMGSFNVRPAP